MDISSSSSSLLPDTSRKLVRLNLFSEEQRISLAQVGVETARGLLTASPSTLMNTLHVAPDELQRLLQRTGDAITQKARTAWELLELRGERGNDVHLAATLEDGAWEWLTAQAGMLTELCGPVGVGKTQMAIMWAIRAVVRHLADGGTCVFIDTENAFDGTRAVQMAKVALQHLRDARSDSTPSVTASRASLSQQTELASVADRVIVFKDSTCQALLQRVQALEEIVIERNVKCVVVDCITSPVTNQFDSSQTADRQAMLNEVASRLKMLANQFNLPVIITNQTRSTQYEVKAALGTLWSHAVNARLMLSPPAPHTNSTLMEDDLPPSHSISLLKSPTFNTSALPVQYGIDKHGVRFF